MPVAPSREADFSRNCLKNTGDMRNTMEKEELGSGVSNASSVFKRWPALRSDVFGEPWTLQRWTDTIQCMNMNVQQTSSEDI